MQYPFNHIQVTALVQSICQLLFNSLWYGIALALVTVVILAATRKAPAARRYRFLQTGLVLYLLALAAAFVADLCQSSQAGSLPVPGLPWTSLFLFKQDNAAGPVYTEGLNLNDKFQYVVSRYGQVLVIAWMVIVLFRCTRLLVGLRTLGALRRSSGLLTDTGLLRFVEALGLRLGLSHMVGIAESAMVAVPVVIGHLKPLILLPVGLVTALSQPELEAVLLHELAHIRRKDFLFNMLLTMTDNLLFFNPVTRWVTALLREEREYCCDELALEHSLQPVSYVQALVACQEFAHCATPLVNAAAAPLQSLSFYTSKQNLMNRVKRILSGDRGRMNLQEKGIVSAGLLLLGTAMVAFTVKQGSEQVLPGPGGDTAINPVRIYQPSEMKKGSGAMITADGATSYVFWRNDSLIQLNLKDSVLFSGQLNGKEFNWSGGQVDMLLKDIRQQMQQIPKPPVPPAAPDHTIPDPVFKAVPADAPKPPAEPVRFAATKANKNPKPAAPPEPTVETIRFAPPKANREPQPAAPPEPTIETVHFAPPAPRPAASADEDRMVEELVKDGLLTRKQAQSAFSISINKDQLLINQVKQPATVHAKYLGLVGEKAAKGTWTWSYRKEVN